MVKQKPARTRLIPWIFVIIWSTGFIAAKYSTPFMSPYFVLFVRFSLACAIFAGVLILTGKSLCSKREAIGQMAVGVLIHAAFLSAVFTAIDQSLPAGLVALVMGLQPITTALIGLIWLQDRLALKQWIGLLLGLFGVWLVVARHAPSTAEIISENTWLIVFGGYSPFRRAPYSETGWGRYSSNGGRLLSIPGRHSRAWRAGSCV